jgi:hypothetical protein
MGVLDWFRSDSGDTAVATVDLDDVLANYELVGVDADHGYMVVARTDDDTVALAHDPPSGNGRVDTRELGGGASDYVRVFQEDYRRDLRGILGIRKYMEIRNDARVRSSLKLAKTPVLAARWYMEPASDSDHDKYIANFIWRNLTLWMNQPWYQFLYETLFMLDYGFYAFEKVFDFAVIDGSQRVIWKKLAPSERSAWWCRRRSCAPTTP